MARRNIQFTQGEYYHIYNRGCNRAKIFHSDENYQFLLRKLRKYFISTEVSVIAFCLMPNHYHFLLRQDGDKSVGGMVQTIFNGYSKAFNQRYNRSGTLFEGPFKAILIEKFSHLIHLCRYIHRNPLDVGLVTNIEKWQYSNYPEWIGLRDDILVDREFIKENYPSSKDYETFVMEYVSPKRIDKDLQKYYFD
jgi:REP element-mobilizing transposase RayT